MCELTPQSLFGAALNLGAAFKLWAASVRVNTVFDKYLILGIDITGKNI